MKPYCRLDFIQICLVFPLMHLVKMSGWVPIQTMLPLRFITGDGKSDVTLDYGIPYISVLDTKVFLLRNCFVDYFNFILANLQEYMHVSLTGSSGVGISVFYIYFVARFRAENPNARVVLASFTEARTPLICRIFNGPDGDAEYFREMPAIEDAFYFFDGAPHETPLNAKMVCFTGPNAEWLDVIEKREDHLMMFFPIWTLAELQAAERLNGSSGCSTEVPEKYEKCGGLPRYCCSFSRRSHREDFAFLRLFDEPS